jgi:hypothetical protein
MVIELEFKTGSAAHRYVWVLLEQELNIADTTRVDAKVVIRVSVLIRTPKK